MKRLIPAILLAAATAMAAASGVEGRWTSEIAPAARKQAGKKAARPAIITLNLKTAGGQLTGTVDAGGGKRAAAMPIQDAKLEGDRFSFTTVRKTRKGEMKWHWRGTVTGDELTGTRTREGARRGQPFTARRAS